MNNEVSFKFSNKIENLNKLEKYSKLLSQIQSISKGIDKGTVKEISEGAKNVSSLNKEASKTDSILSKAFSLGKVTAFLGTLKNVTKAISNYTSKSSAYTENLNLYAVAFDGATESADKFVNKLTEMYGLDESWLVRTTGIFKQLSNAMALSTEQGTKLATLMTQMSIDISSLYNIDIERASNVLQSSLAGQTKPIRGATGGDITQNTLQLTLDNLGIDKYIGDLSFAEKRLIIIISLTQQLSKATNDFGKTIESPSNQMRILNEQWQRLTRAVGNLFLPVLAKVLPYLNAIFMVLTEIINIIASFLGFDLGEFDYGVSSVADSVLDLENGLNGATESASNLKKEMSGLRGFDKLNVIKTPSSAKGTGGAGGAGIDPKIMDAFNKAFDEYNEKLKNVNMKANQIRDNIMEWLGFSKQIDEVTGDISWKFDHLTSGTVLGAFAVGGVIYSGISKIFKILTKLKILDFKSISNLGKTLGKLGPVKYLVGAFDDIGVAIGGWATGAWSFSEAIALIGPAIATIGTVVGGIALAIGGLKIAIEGVNDIIDGEKLKGIMEIIAGIALVVTGVALAFGAWPVAIGGAIVAGIALIVAFWDEISAFFVKIWKWIDNNLLQPIIDFLKPLATWIYNNVIEPIINWFAPIVDAIASIFSTIFTNIAEIVVGVGKAVWSIISKVGEIFLKIVEIFVALGKAFYNYVIDPVVDFIVSIATWVYDKAIKPIMKFFGKVGDWVYTNIIKPIVDKIVWIKDKIVSIFKTVGIAIVDFISGLFKSVINGILSKIESGINGFIKLLNSAIKVINEIPGVDIKKITLLDIPRLKQGLDYVPSDYYGPVFLDHGERVLTKQENIEYNQNKFYTENAKSNILEKQNIKPLNATFVINVGSKKIAEQVLTDLEDMAKSNGKPITING